MARPIRIEYPGAWYHVTCRGNERRAIFSDDRDRSQFLEILFTTRDIYRIEVHAYVLMENHFHLVVMTPEGNLHGFMQRFNTAYTVYYNRRHRRSGHLYQGRYKAILIDADAHLLELTRYLHLNPVRIKEYSGLDLKEKREIIRLYPWSSYRGYIRLKDRQGFMNYSKVLAMVGSGDDPEGRRRYRQFVMGLIFKDMDITFWEDVKGQAVLGSEDFVNGIYERFLSKAKLNRREQPGLKELERGQLRTMEEVAREVAMVFQVPESELYRPRTPCRIARSVFMEICRRYLTRRRPLSEIGGRVGGVSGSALNQNRKRLEARMRTDERLKGMVQKLTETWISAHSQ